MTNKQKQKEIFANLTMKRIYVIHPPMNNGEKNTSHT